MSATAPAVVILGAGGHARVVLSLLRALGRDVAGCIAPSSPDASWPADLPWLGDDAILARLDPAITELANGIGSTGDPARRIAAYNSACAAGFRFPVLVHPGAIVDATALPGPGTQVMAGAILQTGVRTGRNVIVNTGAVIDHDCDIGDHVHLAPGTRLSGSVTVGAGAHLGTGAVAIQNLRIGAGALVAAGAVVLEDVPPGARVAGTPARPMRSPA